MFHPENFNLGIKTENKFYDNILASSQSLITFIIFRIAQKFLADYSASNFFGDSQTKCDDLKQL